MTSFSSMFCVTLFSFSKCDGKVNLTRYVLLLEKVTLTIDLGYDLVSSIYIYKINIIISMH